MIFLYHSQKMGLDRHIKYLGVGEDIDLLFLDHLLFVGLAFLAVEHQGLV